MMSNKGASEFSGNHNSEEWAELIYNVSSDNIFLMSVENQDIFRCITVNSSYLKSTGLNSSQVIGKTPFDVLPPEAASYVINKYNESIKAGHPITYEENVIVKNKQVSVETTLTPIFDDGGKCTHLLGSSHDISYQKESEKALRESEEKYRVLTENINDVVWVLDTETMYFSYVSPSVKKLRGYTSEEVMARHVFDSLTAESVEILKLSVPQTINAFYAGQITKDQFFTSEMEQPCKDGSTVWTEVITSFYMNEKTGHVEVRGVTRDISERKKIEAALDASNQFNKSLLDTFPFGMDIVDESGSILFMNENFLLNFNGDVIGKTCWELYRDDKTQCVQCPLKMNILIGETFTVESSEVMNGHIVQITHTGMLYNGKKAILEIFQDVTDKKQAEKKIQLLAHSLESISECVSITDNDDYIVYVNESFVKTYGYSPNEVIGKHVSMLRPAEVSPRQARNILPETKFGGWRGEIINKRKDGTLFPILLSTSVIKDDNQKPIALIGVATDITEMKKNREELIAAKEKAEEMSRLKSNFLANMGHELRTPMIGILGYAEILSQESQDPMTKDAASTILLSANRLMETLNLILDLSQIEAGKLDLNLVSVDIVQITAEVCKLFFEAAKKKSLFLNMETKYPSLLLNLDARMFRQIIDNLINNALKFTKRGGISIKILTEICNSRVWAVINVKDTGIGIAEKNQNLIWEEFRQVSEGYDRTFEGTGLGLSITKKFVEKMHGTISLKSELNVGSEFTVRFPL